MATRRRARSRARAAPIRRALRLAAVGTSRLWWGGALLLWFVGAAGGRAGAQTPAPAPAAGLSNLVDTLLGAGDTLRWAPGAIFVHTLKAQTAGGRDGLPVVVRGSAAWVEGLPAGTGVRWRYRRFDTDLRGRQATLDSALLGYDRPIFTFDEADRAISISEFQRGLGDVDYSGVFGRGLRFGNSQNLVLDSRLDLQLNGDLGDGLTVAAVVSDQNIPLQPEGNTVQLREFDRIFVTVARAPHSVTAGDYTLRSNAGHFIRFDKNLQGLSYRLDAQEGKGYGGQASVAATRGDFQRIQLPTVDGNQGPYRLTGARGEPFVIVLAGTERVFLDGRLLERGIDRDYIIDYNRGEVTFMPRLLVNRFQRIIVEYEYSDREYLRTLASADAEYRLGPVRLRVQGLQQQDGLRRSGSALSAQAQRVLATSDGDRRGTLVPSPIPVDEAGSANPVQYRLRVDSTCRGRDSIWVLADSTRENVQTFLVNFTDVGQGLGDYELQFGGSANGATFQYVPRGDSCQRRGRYAPLRLVQTPRSLRLLTLGGDYRIDSVSSVDFEVALNGNDLNRYSPGAENAFAGYVNGVHARRLGATTVSLRGYGEVTGDGFEAIAPWRAAEFRRLWNLGSLAAQPTAEPGGDVLAGGRVGLSNEALDLGYGLDAYRQGEAYRGFRQNWRAVYRSGRLTASHAGDLLSAERDRQRTGQSRLSAEVNHRGETWTHAASAARTTSQNYDLVRDDRTPADRTFYEWSASSLRARGDSAWTQSLVYTGRRDLLALAGAAPLDEGTNHQLDVAIANPTTRRNRLELTASYRNTDPGDGPATGTPTPRNFYLGRLNHRFTSARQGWVRTQSLVEAGSGQERRVSIQYLRVQSGLGEYVWKDYNGDGVEQLDEFEVAVFADSAAYLRTVLLTDDFVATNTLTVTQGIDLDPGRLRGADGAWWKRFSASANANLKRRALQSAGYGRLLATDVARQDTTVVGDDLGWRNALYFNRNRDAFRVEAEYRQVAVRGISLQGLQLNRTTGQALRAQQPLGDAWRLGAAFERELRRSESEALAQRNFTIVSQEYVPSVSFQPTPELRAELAGGYRRGRSPDAAGSVVAASAKLTADLRFRDAPPGGERRSPLAGATLRGSVERIAQTFEGDVNSPLGFALLEGLRPGESWVWSLTTDQQLGRSLQLSLRYDGRQLGGGRVVHTGQAQLQAVF